MHSCGGVETKQRVFKVPGDVKLMKTWTKPSFREIQMNAEIGAYQSDWDEGVDRVTSSELAPQSEQSRTSVAEVASPMVVSPTA